MDLPPDVGRLLDGCLFGLGASDPSWTPAVVDPLSHPHEQNYWLPGVLLAAAVGLGWVVTSLPTFWGRTFARIIIAASGAVLLTQDSPNPFVAHFARVGAILWCQSVLFWSTDFPTWRWRPESFRGLQAAPVSSGRQFGIAEILVTTTSAACLFSIMKIYVAPGNKGETWLEMFAKYWAVDSLNWMVLPLIAMGIFQLARARLNLPLRLAGWIAALALTRGLLTVLVNAEFSFHTEDANQYGADVFSKYVQVFCGYGLVLHAFALLAWLLVQPRKSALSSAA